MKHTFKKVVVLALAVLMCVSSIMPSAMAAENTCPGANAAHTATNCSYTESNTTDATCEATGVVMGKCNTCSADVVIKFIEAKGHDWTVTAANCDVASYRTCKVCKKTEIAQAAPGHSWGEWTVNGGECRVGERRVATCTVCGTKKEEIMTEAHSWVVDEFVAPVRCGNPGYAAYVCANGCGAEKTEEVWVSEEDAAHTMIEWGAAKTLGLVVGDDPKLVVATCTNVGTRTMICSVCEFTKIVTTAKSTSHTSADIGKKLQFIDYKPEGCCTGNGLVAYWKCYDCGALYNAVCIDGYYTDDDKPENDDYPKSFKNVTEEGSNGVDQVVSQEFRFYTDRIGPAVKDNKTSNLRTIDNLTHKWSVDEVKATCTTPGYAIGECYVCGKTRDTYTEALGHLYAPDVTSGQKDIIKFVASKNGYDFRSDRNYAWAQFLRLNPDIRVTGTDATCTDDGWFEWRCLRGGCYDTANEGREKEVIPAKGHTYSKDVDVAASTPATCTTPGIHKYKCADCGGYKLENVPALGHLLKTIVVPATCLVDGSSTEDCVRTLNSVGTAMADCGYEADVTPIEAGENDHAWVDTAIGTGAINATCLVSTSVIRSCRNPACNVAPFVYEKAATGHKYLEGDDLLEAIETLVDKNRSTAITTPNYYAHLDTAGNVILDGTTAPTSATKPAVFYEQIGDCSQVAKYRLNCLNENCIMFQYKEVDAALKKGGHDVVIVYRNSESYVNNWGPNGTYAYNETIKDIYDNYGYVTGGFTDLHMTYGQAAPKDHLKATKNASTGEYEINGAAMAKNYFWYCKNAGCAYGRTENGREATEIISVAEGHQIKDGDTYREVKLTDVPDERISKLTPANAKNVEAPVDENGNIIAIAVDIPGTTLVWRYVVEASCEYDEVKVGGFWCVQCQAPYEAGAGLGCNIDKNGDPIVTATRGHNFAPVRTFNADCQNYGYVRKSCMDCDYSVMTKYEPATPHNYVATQDVKPTCTLDGYQVIECTVCKDAKVSVPLTHKAVGHKNIAGISLSESCLDPNWNVSNRYCTGCANVIISDHAFTENNLCKYCGRGKQ